MEMLVLQKSMSIIIIQRKVAIYLTLFLKEERNSNWSDLALMLLKIHSFVFQKGNYGY